jgi:phosphoribosylformylglycinamidine synthase
VDLEHELRLQHVLQQGVAQGLLLSAHDVSDGGLALSLAECTFTGPRGLRVGAAVTLPGGLRTEALLFGESTGRVVASTQDAKALRALALREGVPACVVGETGGDELRIAREGGEVMIAVAVARLHEIWSRALPRRLEES